MINYLIFFQFAIFFGFVAPACILLIVNVLIIFKATQYSRSHGNTNAASLHSERKKAQMTKMILFLTFFHIALEAPNQLYFGYLYSLIDQITYGKLMANLFDFTQYFYPSFHIFILYFSNKQFASEVKEIIFRIKSGKVGSTKDVNNTNQPIRISNSAKNQHYFCLFKSDI